MEPWFNFRGTLQQAGGRAKTKRLLSLTDLSEETNGAALFWVVEAEVD